ncbi:MprA protease, GlyGly-CTERM protein-sorting domain-containing form [Iodobacter sp. BJB302]
MHRSMRLIQPLCVLLIFAGAAGYCLHRRR